MKNRISNANIYMKNHSYLHNFVFILQTISFFILKIFIKKKVSKTWIKFKLRFLKTFYIYVMQKKIF